MPSLKSSLETESAHCLAAKTTKGLHAISQRLKPRRLAKTKGGTDPPIAPPVQRCLLVSEILSLVLAFVQESDEPYDEDRWGRKQHRAMAGIDVDVGVSIGKRTLASLARTCRVFSAPALDRLWMRLDSLDPLIRVFPRCMWAVKRPSFIVRAFMNDKHWSTFHKYAVRVHFLCGPCRGIPPSVQRTVVAALTRCSAASLPLLPNLTELVWGESDAFNAVDSTMCLLRYFAGPRVTTISLRLVSWPIYISARAALADLPRLCPNVTSFTAVPRASLNDHSRDIGDIVQKWPHLQVLCTSTLPKSVMNELASRGTLNTLSIELSNCFGDIYVERLPTTVHTFLLEGCSALHCTRYLQALQGNPTRLRLHVGADMTLPSDMGFLFHMLPIRFDTAQLHHLTVSLQSSFHHSFVPESPLPLTESLLKPLYAFSSLVALDVDSFSTPELDDAAFARMAGAWPELKSLKVGTGNASRARPTASVGAVIAVLRSCPSLEVLHLVFDGSIPPPPLPATAPDEDERTLCEESVDSRVEERVHAPSWGISNLNITEIHVGHSPIGDDVGGRQDLALCLRSIMPRLERIRSGRMLGLFDVGESEGWLRVQRLLTAKAGAECAAGARSSLDRSALTEP